MNKPPPIRTEKKTKGAASRRWVAIVTYRNGVGLIVFPFALWLLGVIVRIATADGQPHGHDDITRMADTLQGIQTAVMFVMFFVSGIIVCCTAEVIRTMERLENARVEAVGSAGVIA